MRYEKPTRYTDRTSRAELPISYVRDRIKDDYFRFGMTLKEVLKKWSMYDPEQINRVLGVYDLRKEPRAGRATRAWFNGELREGWETECQRLNPKAWERRKRR